MMVRACRGLIVGLLLALASACGGGGGGGTSSGTPVPAPTISSQPAAMTVNAGQSATFSVTASGATSYQWQRNGAAISGATSSSYTLNNATSQNNGDSYSVVVSNSGGSVTSSAAALRVTGVSVIAGQLGGEGYVDGPAASARFWGPVGLAIDAGGNLYVTDYNALRMISVTGVVSTLAGSPKVCGDTAGTGGSARFCYPYGVAVDSTGVVYVADAGPQLWQVSAAGASTPYAPNAFSCAVSLAASGGVVYVGDMCRGGGNGNSGLIYQVQGGVATQFATPGGYPMGLALDGAGDLYTANDTIVQQIALGGANPGQYSTIAGAQSVPGDVDGALGSNRFGCALSIPGFASGFTQFNGAGGAAVASGMLYVSDECNDAIRTVSPSGTVTTVAGQGGIPGAVDGQGSAARFWGPAGMVADPAGNVYVADYLSGAIRKITPGGAVSTYAGQLPNAGNADGAGTSASFRYPIGVVADAAGNLYVSDSYNHVLRKITPAGVVSTFAGTSGVAGATDGALGVGKFNNPQGLAIDGSGNIYVADKLNDLIRMVTPAGVISTVAGQAGNASTQDGTGGGATFDLPTAIAIDATGNLYVGEQGGLRQIATGGVVTSMELLQKPVQSVTVASSGAVYFAAGYSPSVTIYSQFPNGVPVVIPGGSSGFSSRVSGLAFGGDGNLYVADQLNSVIKQITPGGTVSVVAGDSSLPIAAAPGGLPAKLNAPAGMALLSTGKSVSLAVVESFEHAVLRVDLP